MVGRESRGNCRPMRLRRETCAIGPFSGELASRSLHPSATALPRQGARKRRQPNLPKGALSFATTNPPTFSLLSPLDDGELPNRSLDVFSLRHHHRLLFLPPFPPTKAANSSTGGNLMIVAPSHSLPVLVVPWMASSDIASIIKSGKKALFFSI